jgi:hypothetical protein
MNMSTYGKIEVMDGTRYGEVFGWDLLAGDRGFTKDSPKISRCIRRSRIPGVIILQAHHYHERYELGFMEQAFPIKEHYIKNSHGYYSIYHGPFRGVGRVVEICRFNEPGPFAQFYHILTCSNKRKLLWLVGIRSFSKEMTNEDEWPEPGDPDYQGEAPHPQHPDGDLNP